MPIYEYQCQHCNMEFERLELKASDRVLVAQCPSCKGAGLLVISAPAIVYEDLKTRLSPDRLPTWHQKNKEAKCHDAWMRYRQTKPLPTDRGAGTKVYETDGVKDSG